MSNNIKSLVKKYVILHSNNFREQTFDVIESKVEDKLLSDKINEFNKYRENVDRKITELYDEIDEIKTQAKGDSEKIKKMYMHDLEELQEFLRQEKINYITMISGSASIIQHLPDIQESIKENKQKIKGFLSDLDKLNSGLKAEAKTTVNEFKNDIKEYLGTEKKRLSDELRTGYEKIEKEIHDYKRKQIKEIITDENLKSFKKGSIFTKYNCILILCIIIIIFDFLLMQDIFGEMNPKNTMANRMNGKSTFDLLYNVIFPLIFSFGIVLIDSVNKKIVKNFNKVFRIIIEIFVRILSSGIVVFPILVSVIRQNWNFLVLSTTDWLLLFARGLIFIGFIPITVFLIDKYFTRDYLSIYIKTIFNGIKTGFLRIFTPITFCGKMIKRLLKPIEYKIKINLNNIGLKFKGKQKNELQDMINLGKLYYNDVDSVKNSIREIKYHTKLVVNQLKGGNKIFDEAFSKYQKAIDNANKQLDKQLKDIENESQGKINVRLNEIKFLGCELGKNEENIENERLMIKEGVLEALNEINNESIYG